MTTYKNHLPVFGALGYISPAPHKTGAGFSSLLTTQAHSRASGFFTCKASSRLFVRIMAGRMGGPQGSPGSCVAGLLTLYASPPLRLAASGGELSQLTTQGYPSWPTANSAAPTLTFSASIPRPKSTADSIAPTHWRSSFRPICVACHVAQCRYGCRQSWTTSPTISAIFRRYLTSQRTPCNPSIRPGSSGAFVHPVNREVWL
ncbi:TPA: ash family protein [Salmonella enterica]|nr:ash family protein [Salmonella enterica]ELZ6779158.1 ash family protein [Salmonella enterica]HDY3663848.1 ash family protein [Salmonella enterica]